MPDVSAESCPAIRPAAGGDGAELLLGVSSGSTTTTTARATLLPRVSAAIQKVESMIDVHLHFRGAGSDRRRLPAVPVVGSYIFGPGADGRLWRVEAVVLDGAAVVVYCAQESAMLAAELTATWATWGRPMEQPSPLDKAAKTIILMALKVRTDTIRFSPMLILNSIPQNPSGPSRPAMPATWSNRRVNRTGRALQFLGRLSLWATKSR